MATETVPPKAGDDGQPEAKPKSGLEAVDRVAGKEPGEITPQEASMATDWFLSTEAEEVASAFVPVNVAPAGHPEHIVDFKVQVVDRDRIKNMRKECEVAKPNGEREVDEMEANLRLVVEGLIDPNIKGDPRFREVRGQTFVDPADALRARFGHKPGLIDQLAGKITQISGYNTEDVKEVKAAGN